MRPLPLLVASLVLAASVGLSLPLVARATSHLEVDAGATQVAYDGATLTLKGQARGGTAPYTYAWSGAAASRFGNAASPTSTFDTAGLAVGNLTLTLTVTDAASATASDTVVLRMDTSTLPLSTTRAVTIGLSEEDLGVAADNNRFNVIVPARTGMLDARLSWVPSSGAVTPDLDLTLYNPFGPVHDPAQGHAGTNPETTFVADPFTGTWRVDVVPRAGTSMTYTLTVRLGTVALLPEANAGHSYEFGSAQTQSLSGSANFGVAPYTYEWDANADGWFESTGASATASLPVGTHVVVLRVTDSTGLSDESRATVVVRDGDRVVKVGCTGDSAFLPNMEFTASKGSCWLHGGHHTYYLGDVYAFRGARGFAYAVEQEYAPSADAVNLTAPLTTPLRVEVSADGQAWTEVGFATYVYGPVRQYVFFDLEGANETTRFVRIQAPLSLSQGLSGYVDASELRLELDDLTDVVVPGLLPSTKSLDCKAGDVMEDFFATHPCWFGGVDRYDSPSFFHTYVAGPDSTLTRAKGNFTLAPWRSDDFFAAHPVTQINATKAFLQVSSDGQAWTTVATIPATYGVPREFDVALSGTATFVRLFPEYHANFDNLVTAAAHHHPRAFFLDSRVALDGTFGSWA